MKNAFATLVGWIIAGCVCGYFMGPVEADETISIGDVILCTVIGMPIMLGVMALWGEPTHSKRYHEE